MIHGILGLWSSASLPAGMELLPWNVYISPGGFSSRAELVAWEVPCVDASSAGR